MKSSDHDRGEKESLVMCAILKRILSADPLKESAIQEVYEQISRKKKRHPKNRYVARVSSKQIKFERIEKAKKRRPIPLAEINHMGRIPADPNGFSLQVQKEKKKKKKGEDNEDDSSMLVYLLRFEYSAALDTFYDAINSNKTHSTTPEAPLETKRLREGQNIDKHNKAIQNDGFRTARNEDSSVGLRRRTEHEHMTMREKRNSRKAAAYASEASKVSYLDGIYLGETASSTDFGQPPVDSQQKYYVCSGSETHMHHSRPSSAPLSRHAGNVSKRPAIPQQHARTRLKQTFTEYRPPVGLYPTAPVRQSRIVVDPWPQRSYSHRKAYTPSLSGLSMTSASSDVTFASSSSFSEVTLFCSVTPTQDDVDRELAFLEDRRRWRGMYKSYRCPYQDSVF